LARTRRQKLGIAVTASGLLCLLLGAWMLAQLRVSLARGPMLLAPFGLAVGPEGSVLVGVHASRVHVYDGEGRFLRALEVPDTQGPFRLRAPAEGRLEVATARSAEHIELDLAGNLYRRTPDEEAYARFGPDNDFEATAPSGERYSIETGALVRLHPAPEVLLVPAARWPLALFVDALPLVALLTGGGAVGIFCGIALTSRRGAT
jgi:hypothetical protein